MEDKTVGEFIDSVLKHEYDPTKAHEYYMRTRQLKGRHHNAKPDQGQSGHVIPFRKKAAAPATLPPQVQERVNQLKVRLSELQARLQDLLSKKQVEKHKKPEPKTAADKAKEARASKRYRDTHKTQIAQKRKQAAAKSGGGTPISSMTEEEVRLAIARTHAQLQAAVSAARAAVNRGTA